MSIMINEETYISEQPFYWLSVEPLEFIVDLKTNIALSKDIIFATLSETLINTDIIEKIYQDIISHPKKEELKAEEKEENKNSDIDKLVDEIKKMTSFDALLHKKIIEKIEKLIQNYNQKIILLRNNFENNNGLSLNLETKETIKMSLIIELAKIIDELKKFIEVNNIYYDMLNYLTNCINVFEKELKEGELQNELEKDLFKISSITKILNLREQNQIKEQILKILKREKLKIREYLVNTIKKEPANKPTYNTNEQLELFIRKLMHPILINLKNKITGLEIGKIVSKGIKEIIDGIYVNSNQNIINFYLDIVNELVTKIELNLSNIKESYILETELKFILEHKINYEQDILNILKELEKMIIALYKLNNKIEKYINEQENYDELIYTLKK